MAITAKNGGRDSVLRWKGRRLPIIELGGPLVRCDTIGKIHWLALAVPPSLDSLFWTIKPSRVP